MNLQTMGVMLVLGGSILGIPLRADAGAEILRPRLVVRTYPRTTMGSDEWRATLAEAGEILHDAGIEVEWIDCATPVSSGPSVDPRCEAPLKKGEAALRIVRQHTPTTYRGELPLGESLVDPTHASGTLATIYLDRVEWLARVGHASTRTLLARAVAHELGHLMLGTHDHSHRGLMRPVWTRDEVLRRRDADWRIPAADAARMRESLMRRLAAAGDDNIV